MNRLFTFCVAWRHTPTYWRQNRNLGHSVAVSWRSGSYSGLSAWPAATLQTRLNMSSFPVFCQRQSGDFADSIHTVRPDKTVLSGRAVWIRHNASSPIARCPCHLAACSRKLWRRICTSCAAQWDDCAQNRRIIAVLTPLWWVWLCIRASVVHIGPQNVASSTPIHIVR